MSDWTNLRDIMRDLSVAQGRRVPAYLETFGNTAPPTVSVREETEEAYYKSNVDIDFSEPPDFSLIQEMLSVVRHKNEISKDDIILNSELNPLTPVFVPYSKSDTAIIKTKRREKNVAISSILRAQGMNSPIQLTDIPKSPSSMFTKRTTPSKQKKEATVCTSHSVTPVNGGQYIPSALASVYYNKYLVNSKLKEQIKEDLWSRVEEQMEEIDKMRLITQKLHSNTQDLDCNGDVSNGTGNVSHASGDVSHVSGDVSQGSGDVSYNSGDVSYNSGDVVLNSGDVSYGSSTSSKYGLKVVSLLHHRHLMLDSAADCVVCRVTDKHGYSFTEEGD